MIFQSASKIVFILLAVALCGLTAFGKVDAKDFIMLTGMCFSYYFSKNANNNITTSQDTTVNP